MKPTLLPFFGLCLLAEFSFAQAAFPDLNSPPFDRTSFHQAMSVMEPDGSTLSPHRSYHPCHQSEQRHRICGIVGTTLGVATTTIGTVMIAKGLDAMIRKDGDLGDLVYIPVMREVGSGMVVYGLIMLHHGFQLLKNGGGSFRRNSTHMSGSLQLLPAGMRVRVQW